MNQSAFVSSETNGTTFRAVTLVNEKASHFLESLVMFFVRYYAVFSLFIAPHDKIHPTVSTNR